MKERKVTTRTKQPAAERTVRVVRSLVPAKPKPKTSVVFIHGMWLHASSWQRWVDYFNNAAFDARAPGWPDFPDSVEQTRANPDFMAEQTVGEVVDHYAHIIRELPSKAVVIGHSFGGLIAQELLDRGLVKAAVAIDPAPIKGVLSVPLAQIRASWPVLGHPFTRYSTVSLNPHQFRYSFANRLSESEAARLYYDYTIPAPGMPLWQAALANFNRRAETKVNVRKNRGPLLLMAGGQDHTVPPQTTRLVKNLYRDSPALTELKEWPTRGHSLVIDRGWRQVADYALRWLHRRNIR